MQSQVYLLECTPAAMTSEWVQSILASFSRQTGFRVQRQLLDLHTYWVSKRTRWWCTVSRPALNTREIPEIPKRPFNPSFLHLFSKYIHGHSWKWHERDRTGFVWVASFSWKPLFGKACGWSFQDSSHGYSLVGVTGQCLQLRMSKIWIQCWQIGRKGFVRTNHPNWRRDHAWGTAFPQVSPPPRLWSIALANGLNPLHMGNNSRKCRLELAGVGQLASLSRGLGTG